MKQLFFICLILTISYVVNAQKADSCNHELKGTILDADTKEALPYVKVTVQGTKHVSLTDINGNFHIKGLCNELNTLVISCFGYCNTICEQFHQDHKSPYIYLKHEVTTLDGVTIKAERIKDEGTASISQKTIGKGMLSSIPTQTFASAIAEVDGVTFTSTGNNVQLPVIHGLYGNRVLILNNGLKHGFQNWGTDHAPEIDVLGASSITVVKGAAGVRYGPEALGGAVIVEADPLYLNESFKSQIGTGYETNGKGYFVNSEMGQGLKNWSYHVGANYTRVGDRNAPDYSLTNSGKEEKAINAGLRYHLDNWDFKVYYSYVDQNLGILRGAVAETADSFTRAINSIKPNFISPFSYDINEPNQLIQHHLGKAEINWRYSDDAKLTFRVGRQLNKRQEYDVRRNADKPIIDLALNTNDYQLEWKHPSWFHSDGLVGLQVFTQDNDNDTAATGVIPFIPNYNILRYSGFVIESFKRDKNTYEAGIRVDYEYNNVRGRDFRQNIFRDNYSFTNVTSSLGYIRQVSDNTTFRTNIGTAWRTPNMAELYSFGQHGFKATYGLLRYTIREDGKPSTANVATMSESNISPEQGYKWINEWQIEKKKNTYTVTAYSNYIQNFIFDRPLAVVGTFRGPMPVFVYDQADALFIGADFTWQKKWSNSIDGTFGASYLWSKDIKKNEPLIHQPPITTSYKLTWKMKDFWKIKSSQFSIKPSYTFEQFQAPRTVSVEELIDGTANITSDSEIFDFIDAPSGYFLVDATWKFRLNQFGASLSVQNLFNTSYRSYLDELRYFADASGRNFLFTIQYKFNSKTSRK